MEEKKQKKNPMVKIATFIVDKRNLFFLIYIVALIFSVFAKSWVKVDNELTDYLPEIEEAYGDSVATYKDYYDFKEKLEYYLAHPEVRAEMAQRARQITLERFTADKAAQIFDGIFKNIKK